MAEEIPIRVKPVDYVAEKYLTRARAAVEDWKKWIANPRRGPATAAIAARGDLEAKMRKKETWDKWEARLKAIGDKGVIAAALAKADRFPQGIEYGAKYYKQFYEQFSKHLEEGLKKVLAMPKVTLDDAKRRACAMIDWNAKFRFVKKYTE